MKYYTTSQSRRLDFKILTWITCIPWLVLVPLLLLLDIVAWLVERAQCLSNSRWVFRTWVWHHYKTWRRIGDDGKIAPPVCAYCCKALAAPFSSFCKPCLDSWTPRDKGLASS